MKKMTRRKDPAAFEALKGRLCIYKEKICIDVVRVTQVKVNDCGVRFTFDIVSALGYREDGPGNFSASSPWDCLGSSDRAIWAYYVGWTLVFRSDLVEQVTSAAGRGKKGVELREYLYSLTFGKEEA